MGVRTKDPDPALLALLDQVEPALLQAAEPKSLYREFACTVQGRCVAVGPFQAESRDLARNLAGCRRAILLAATLGPEVDRLYRRLAVSHMAEAAALQGAAAALVEAYCDQIQASTRREKAAEGLFLRPRFSPGYGDLPLDCQRQFFAILECNKRLGMGLTDSLLMVPSKSVTAIIGITEEAPRQAGGCAACGSRDCPFRKEV